MSHTPGPWVIEVSTLVEHPGSNLISSEFTAIGEPIAKIGGEELGEAVEFMVGRTCDFGPHGVEQTKANAHLIAAAPELLEVCEKLVVAQGWSEMHACIVDAREAIAKAKGEFNESSLR